MVMARDTLEVSSWPSNATGIMSKANQGLTPYTVRHKNSNGEKLESCFYANDAYEARLLAMEFNAYIKQHPNCIDSILQTNN